MLVDSIERWMWSLGSREAGLCEWGWVEVFMCLGISVCAYSELVFHSIKQWWLVPSIYPRVGAEQRRAGGENKKVPHPAPVLAPAPRWRAEIHYN